MMPLKVLNAWLWRLRPVPLTIGFFLVAFLLSRFTTGQFAIISTCALFMGWTILAASGVSSLSRPWMSRAWIITSATIVFSYLVFVFPLRLSNREPDLLGRSIEILLIPSLLLFWDGIAYAISRTQENRMSKVLLYLVFFLLTTGPPLAFLFVHGRIAKLRESRT